MGSRKRLFVRHLPSMLRIMSGGRLHTVKASSSQLDFTYNFGNTASHGIQSLWRQGIYAIIPATRS
jgi:hypothetical protein